MPQTLAGHPSLRFHFVFYRGLKPQESHVQRAWLQPTLSVAHWKGRMSAHPTSLFNIMMLTE